MTPSRTTRLLFLASMFVLLGGGAGVGGVDWLAGVAAVAGGQGDAGGGRGE